MLQTYEELWRAVGLYSPVLPTSLAQQFITSRFRDIRRKRLWSWRIGKSQVVTPTATTIGLATATIGSQIVTGIGTNWTPALVGLQFRFGTTAPIYTVIEVDSNTQLVIDMPFGGTPFSSSGASYQIFMAYITPPADFQDFLSFTDVYNNYRLALHISQEYLDSIDAQRASTGNAYCVADFRYNTNPTSGSVKAQVMASGTPGDPAPIFSGAYTGRAPTIYTVIVTVGGPLGTAEFSWQEGNGTVNTGNVTDPSGLPYQMSDGVSIQFPLPTPPALAYKLLDVFVCSAAPGLTLGLPQYELWPYTMTQRVYPFLYDKRFPDLSNPNGVVPPYIDGDIIVKGALADLCRWKGTETRSNPMYSLDTSLSYEKEFERKVAEMEREDDEVYLVDVRYQLLNDMGMNLAPFPYGADYAQNHALPGNTMY